MLQGGIELAIKSPELTDVVSHAHLGAPLAVLLVPRDAFVLRGFMQSLGHASDSPAGHASPLVAGTEPVNPRSPRLYAKPLPVSLYGARGEIKYRLVVPEQEVWRQAPLFPLGMLGLWMWHGRRTADNRTPLDGYTIYRREQIGQPPYHELTYRFVGHAPQILLPNKHNGTWEGAVKDVHKRLEKYEMSTKKQQTGVPLRTYLQDVRVLLAYLELAEQHILQLSAQLAQQQTPINDQLAQLQAEALQSQTVEA